MRPKAFKMIKTLTSTMMHIFPQLLPFILGLGVPRSFSLLYVVFAIILWRAAESKTHSQSPLVIYSSINLILFGTTYSLIMIWHGTWMPIKTHIPEILAITALPAMALMSGWNIESAKRESKNSRMIILYIIGALTYALMSVAASHDPAWNITQTFNHVMKVPWGPNVYESTRAIEQRAFLALCLAPCIFLKYQKISKNLLLKVSFIAMASLGLYVTYTTQSRIGLVSLYLSSMPLAWLIRDNNRRYILLALLVAAPPTLIATNKFCDERLFLVNKFITHMAEAPMGGRLIRFQFANCLPDGISFFGNYDGITTFSPHNVVLDVYNDTGIVPFIFMISSLVPLVGAFFIGFLKSINQVITPSTLLRWAVFSVLVIQWVAQPFLYTDQLMFTLGFFFIGMFLREKTQSDCLP